MRSVKKITVLLSSDFLFLNAAYLDRTPFLYFQQKKVRKGRGKTSSKNIVLFLCFLPFFKRRWRNTKRKTTMSFPPFVKILFTLSIELHKKKFHRNKKQTRHDDLVGVFLKVKLTCSGADNSAWETKRNWRKKNTKYSHLFLNVALHVTNYFTFFRSTKGR